MISIIGTRPQYIKVKPIYDYCLKNGISHKIIDTGQHYSNGMSKQIIEDLEIKTESLGVKGKELEFIANLILRLKKVVKDKVLVYGDTNSSFTIALVCYKLGIRFAHIEAGARCFNNKVPEEVNRQFIDMTSTWNFCSFKPDLKNISNGILAGDLEYELLNKMNPTIESEGFGILTVHRQENMTQERIEKIFSLCEQTGVDIILPIHHRLKSQVWFKEIKLSDNLYLVEPYNYSKMVEGMAKCRFLITDSGSVQKTAPFFGKRCLVLRSESGIRETIEKGYARICTFTGEDLDWLQGKVKPDKKFYLYGQPSEIIINEII